MRKLMTSKERILAALDKKEPDRVPVFEMALNEASIVNVGKHFTDDVPAIKHLSDMTLEEQIRLLEVLSLVLRELGNDGISTVFIFRKEKAGDKLVRDKYGTVYRLSEVGEPIPVGGPVQGPKDISRVVPMEPDPADLVMLHYLIQKMGRDVAHFFTLPGPFRFSWQLRGGMEKLLLDYMRDPDLVHTLARMTTDFCKAAVGLAADAGADVIVLEGDLAFNTNTLMSPDQYRRFVKPYHAEIVEFCHSRRLRVVKHSDGNLWPILEDLVEVGFDGIHPIQPQCMDIGQVKARLQGRTAVLGNIDCSFLLPFGTPEEVDAAVKETIRKAAPGGGYIISSSNSIHPGCKPENYIAMVRAARRYGEYPIRI